MLVNFHNVTISINAVCPKQAYTKLCDALDPLVRCGPAEYTTDTFSLNSDEVYCPTEELWGVEDED